MQHIDNKGLDNLICGIVKTAVDDWKNAKRRLKKCPTATKAEWIVTDCETFFKSEYFFNLTGMNGSEFLKRLEEQELGEARRGRRAKV